MKKRFKSLLALVLVVILAFSSLGGFVYAVGDYQQIGTAIDPAPMGVYDLQGADLVIFKKASTYAYVWVAPNLGYSDGEIRDIVRDADDSLQYYNNWQIKIYNDDFQTADFESVHGAYKVDFDFTSGTFEILWRDVSHVILLDLADKTGSLKVQKRIIGDTDPVEGNYQIQVVFTGSNLEQIVDGDLVGVPGDGTMTYTLFLTHDQEFTFTNIPKETEYSVSEIDLAIGWENFAIEGNATGTIGENGIWDFKCKLKNKYHEDGSLMIEKKIPGYISGTDGDYLISVAFTGDDLSGMTATKYEKKQYGFGYNTSTLTPVDGVYSFFIDDDSYVEFKNIPLNTEYLVTETPDDSVCRNTGITNNTGTIGVTGFDITSTVTNEYRDNTTFDVKKLVTDTDETAGSGDYLINVTFTSDYDISDITCNAPDAVKDPASTEHSVTFSFFLGDTDKATFYNVPKGAAYSVTESDFADGWELVGIVHNTAIPGTVDGLSVAAATLRCPAPPPDVIVTNTYDPNGSLAVTKVLADGSPTPTSTDYAITVVFSGDADLSVITYDGVAAADMDDSTDSVTGDRTFTYFTAGGTCTFNDIPENTAYTINETVTGRWVKDADLPIIGDITTGADATETITNSYDYPDPGTLTVTKDITSDADSYPDSGYTVKVRFYGTGLSAITADPTMTALGGTKTSGTDGTGAYDEYSFFLDDTAPIVFSNIPAGTDYTVSETIADTRWECTNDGYDPATGLLDEGSIEDGDTDEVSINNTFTHDPGSLTVNKVVYENGRSWNENPFEFTVRFETGSSADYTLGTGSVTPSIENDTDESGVTYTFSLTPTQTFIIENIPYGTEYEVTETNDQGADYTGTADGSDDTDGTFGLETIDDVDQIENLIVTFVNSFTYEYYEESTGDLTVTKNVVNSSLWNQQRFAFTVTLDNLYEPEPQYRISATTTGSYYGYDFETEVPGADLALTCALSLDEEHVIFTFSLSDNESITFKNIKPGGSYAVNETNTQGASSTTYSPNSSGNFARHVGDGLISTDDVTIDVTNTYQTYYSPSYYNLTVTKALAGDAAVDTDQFNFEVTLSNFAGVRYSINGAASEAVTAGVTNVALGDGDTVVFSNILEGTPFSVTETNFGDYTVSAAGAGVTVDGATASGSMSSSKTVSYTNTKNGETPPPPSESGTLADEDESGVLAEEDVLPQTGGIAGSTALGLFGVVLLLAGAVLGIKKRRTDRD